MKIFTSHSPLLFALSVTIAAMLCLLWPIWVPGLSLTVQILLGRVAICLFAIFLLTYLGWWREVGFVRFTSWRFLLPYFPLALLLIAIKTMDTMTMGIHISDPALILLGLVVYMAGGFMEEAVFRGLVLRSLLSYGLLRAAFLSSLLFALAHFLNLLVGANLNATIVQVVIAFLAGFVFTAPLAVTKNIWPLVIIHGLNNFVGYLNAGGFLNTASDSASPSLLSVLVSLLPFVLLGIYSIWLLRRAEVNSLISPHIETSISQA